MYVDALISVKGRVDPTPVCGLQSHFLAASTGWTSGGAYTEEKPDSPPSPALKADVSGEESG